MNGGNLAELTEDEDDEIPVDSEVLFQNLNQENRYNLKDGLGAEEDPLGNNDDPLCLEELNVEQNPNQLQNSAPADRHLVTILISDDDEKQKIFSSIPSPKKKRKRKSQNWSKTSRNKKKKKEANGKAKVKKQLKFNSEVEFKKEMDKVVSDTIDESLLLFQRDPKEYHPYYLRIFKYITIGQQLGYFSSIQEVNSIWEKYDTMSLARGKTVLNEEEGETSFTGEESPYATFIKTGKVIVNGKEITVRRNLSEVLENLNKLEDIARAITEKWKRKRKGGVKPDLGTRLEFFSHCKTMTYPSDCVEMNKLWSYFMNKSFPPPPPAAAPPSATENPPVAAIEIEINKKVKVPSSSRKPSNNVVKAANPPPQPPPSPAKELKMQKSTRKFILVPVGTIKRSSQLQLQPSLKRVAYPGANELKRKRARQREIEEQSKNIPKEENENKPDIELLDPPSPSLPFDEPTKKEPEDGPIAAMSLPSNPSVMITVKYQQKNRRHNMKDGHKKTPQKNAKIKSPEIKCKSNSSKLLSKKNTQKKKKGRPQIVSILKRLKKKQAQQQPSSRHVTKFSEPKLIKRLETMICFGKSKSRPNTMLKKEAKTKSTKPGSFTLSESSGGGNQAEAEKSLNAAPIPSPNALSAEATSIEAPEANQLQICDECGEILNSKLEVLRHKRLSHPIQIKCEVCGINFPSFEIWTHFVQEHTFFGQNYRELDPTGFLSLIENENEHEKDSQGKDNNELIPQAPPQPYQRRGQKSSNNNGSNCELTSCTCPTCGKLFARSQLERHIAMVHDAGAEEKKNMCPHCGKLFKSKDWMSAHIKQEHLGKNYRCDLCNRNMQAPGKLWKHKVDVHGLTDLEPPPGTLLLQCDICGEQMLRGMLRHVEKCHPDRPEIAEQIRNKQAEELKRKRKPGKPAAKPGKKRKSVGPKYCSSCGQMINEKWYCGHLRKVHGQDQRCGEWPCPKSFCENRYLTKMHLNRHLYQEHFSLGETLKESKLVQRQRQQQGEEDCIFAEWSCKICQEILKDTDEIKIHFLLKHRQTLDKIMPKTVINKLKLTTTTPPRSLVCPYYYSCKEEFQSDEVEDLHTHLEAEHPEKCLRCPEEECDKFLISPEEFHEHFFLEHQQPDPLLLWKQRFSETKTRILRGLGRSQNANRGIYKPWNRDKIFSCPKNECKMKFYDTDEMSEHFKKVHPSELRKCPHNCNKTCFTEHAMLWHLADKHGLRRKLKPKQKAKLIFYEECICEICQAEVTFISYKFHLQESHGIREDGELWKCPCEGRIWTSREYFLNHMEELHKGRRKELIELVRKINCKDYSQVKKVLKKRGHVMKAEIDRRREIKRRRRRKKVESSAPNKKTKRAVAMDSPSTTVTITVPPTLLLTRTCRVSLERLSAEKILKWTHGTDV